MAVVVPSGAAPAAVHDLTLPHTTPDQIAALEPAVCVGDGHAHRCTGGCRRLRKEAERGDGQALTALEETSAGSRRFQGGLRCCVGVPPELT
jgi:hypothetical protein